MKIIDHLGLKLAGLGSLIGFTTACGDMAQVQPKPPGQSVSAELAKMDRLTNTHSSTPAMAGGSCGGGGRPGGGEF